jgi:Tol biopolymer transport system component
MRAPALAGACGVWIALWTFACVGDSAGITSTEPDAGGTSAPAPDGARDDGGGGGLDGSVDDADARVDGSAVDAGAPACDPTMPFTSIGLVPGLNTPEPESDVRLSEDELEAWYIANHADAGANEDIFHAARATKTAAFGAIAPVAELNSPTPEDSPTVSSDLRTMIFTSARIDAGNDLWVTTRATPIAAWGAPALITSVNSASSENDAFLTPDGTALLFQSLRASETTDLFVSVKVGSTFGAATPIAELNSSGSDQSPILSRDRLTIYYSSSRTDIPGFKGIVDVFVASRTTAEGTFGTPRVVPELNTEYRERPNWLSPDGCRLYFQSDRAGQYDIYVAERQP